MANIDGTSAARAATDQRILQSLTHYLRRRNYKRDELPTDDPVLQNKTLAQINKAFDSMEAEVKTPLDDFYLGLMDGRDEYCTTPGTVLQKQDWTPLGKLRWKPLKCSHVLRGSTLLIFTPVDVFSIMWCRVELQRTVRCFYGIQSLLARENAAYYLAYTANPRSKKPSWRLRSLGNHEVAKGLPIILGTTSAFSARNRRAFEELNPLPKLLPIPPEQSEIHDFIVQIIVSGETGELKYKGRKHTDSNLVQTPPIAQDIREGGVEISLNETLLERARAREAGEEATRGNANRGRFVDAIDRAVDQAVVTDGRAAGTNTGEASEARAARILAEMAGIDANQGEPSF